MRRVILIVHEEDIAEKVRVVVVSEDMAEVGLVLCSRRLHHVTLIVNHILRQRYSTQTHAFSGCCNSNLAVAFPAPDCRPGWPFPCQRWLTSRKLSSPPPCIAKRSFTEKFSTRLSCCGRSAKRGSGDSLSNTQTQLDSAVYVELQLEQLA